MATPMPEPSDRSAPKWDGDHRTLNRFLETYKRVAVTDAKLPEYDAVRAIISYIPSYIRSDVENYVEYSDKTVTWDNFKKRILKDYPRAEEHGGYTRQEFYEWASKHVNRSLRTEDDLETFVREIRRLTTQLIAKAHLSEGEAGAVFEEAMRRNFGEVFRTELYRAKGRQQTYSIDEIFAIAKDVVKMERGGRFLSPELAAAIGGQPAGSTYTGTTYGGSTGPTFLTPSAPVAMTVAPLAPQIKSEEATVLMQQLLQAIQNLSTQGNASQSNYAPANQSNYASASRPAYPARWNGGGGTGTTGDLRCYYCGDKHMMYNCPVAKHDLTTGRVAKNGDNMYVYPDGGRILGPREISLAEKVDAWNKAHGHKSASAMLVGVKEPGAPYQAETSETTAVPTFDSTEAEAAWHDMMTRQVFAYQQKKEMEGVPKRAGLRSQTKATGNEERRDEPPHEKESHTAKEKAKAKEVEAEIRRHYPSATIEEIPDEDEPSASRSSLETSEQHAPAQPAREHSTAVIPAMSARPQFKIQAANDAEELGKAVGERVLETRIVLTVDELVSICPSVRRYWKERLTGKKAAVAYESAEAYALRVADSARVFRYRVMGEEDKDSRDQITAAHILPLRYLDCRIGSIEAEGVIDGGAQIIILSQRLWEAIGKPIDRSKIMKLEAANSTNSQTYGLCADLEVRVGGIPLLLQAQVVEDAPFDLLLGRPFFAIACTEERTMADGRSHITIHDPNSDLAVTLPTKERQVEKKFAPGTEQDF